MDPTGKEGGAGDNGKDGGDAVQPTPVRVEGARAQPPTTTSTHAQLHGHTSAASVARSLAVASEAQEEPLLEVERGGPSQQAGAAAASMLGVGEGEGVGATVSSSAGLIANGAADLLQASREEHEMRNTPAHVFLGTTQDHHRVSQLEQLRLTDFHKYRRFAQKWLQRRNGKQRQQQPQQQPHQSLRQLLQPPPGQDALPGQRLHGRSQSFQGVHEKQQDWGLLHQQVQYGTNIGLPPNQAYQPQHHSRLPFGQPYAGVPAQVVGNPPQGGMISMAQRQSLAFSLAQGTQPPAGAASAVSAARDAGDAIDLTDETAAPATAQPPVPSVGAPAASAQLNHEHHQDWRAYQAYMQQHHAQQFLQLHQQQEQRQQQQRQQSGAGMHVHLQHMQMLQNGVAAGRAAGEARQGVLGLSHQQEAMSYPQHAGHRQLPDYGNGHAGMKRPRYEERSRYEADENEAGTVTFSLISTSFFTAKIRKPTPSAVHTYFKLTPGATYDEKERRWKFPLGAHENLAGALSRQGVQVVPVPRQALAAATLAVEPEQGADGEKDTSVKLCDKMVPESIRKHLAPFQKQGVEFVLKKEGRAMIADEMGLGKTIQAISCAAAYEAEWPLLIVSPSSARYHWEHELLKWLDEDSITKKQITVVCKRKQDLNRGEAKVVIISYELVNRMREELDLFNFGVVVCDECHYLKNQRAARTKAIVPLATKARRAILLSGTPALSRPSELFTQLNLLSASTWASYRDFGKRYCSGKRGKGKKGKFGADFSGASHIAELHALLRATVMVRRLKKNILKHLPPKQRSLVEVHVDDDGARRELQEDLSLLATRHNARLGRLAKEHADKPSGNASGGASQSAELAATAGASLVRPRPPKPTRVDPTPKGKGNGRQPKVAPGAGRVTRLSAPPPVSTPKEVSPPSTTNGSANDIGGLAETSASHERDVADMTKAELAQERRSLLMKLFADTGTAKIPAVIRHVTDILADEMSGGKVLVFAHHRNVLDALEQSVVRTGRVEYIRIDGRTKPKDRQELVDTFQSNPSVRVALLGLTAAGIGITLTAASRVVFAELYWTPAQLLQAEDRCHRIGQATMVKVQYLVAKGSLDDALWPLIQEKIKLLGEMVEGEGEANQMEIKSPDSKKSKRPSSSTSVGEPTEGEPTEGEPTEGEPTKKGDPTQGEAAAPDSVSRSVSADKANGSDPAVEQARAAFEGLQASVVENAQELAVEDMRQELDDEGRREFFEEQGDEGEGSRGGGDSDGYSSGYSDGGGGQDRGDSMVCDLADSNDEGDDNVVCDLASVEENDDVDVGSWPEAQPPVLHPTDSESWKQGKSSSAPIGLEAAIALAKAKNAGDVASKASPEGVIDLLSGDEGEERGDPPSPQTVAVSTTKPQLNGLANDERAGNAGETAMATQDAVRSASGSHKLGVEGEEGLGAPPSLPPTVEVVTAMSR